MTNIQEFTQKKRDSPLETAHITPETVKKKLLALKPIKYPGPDSLLVEEIVRPLANITNKSLKEGKLLQESHKSTRKDSSPSQVTIDLSV